MEFQVHLCFFSQGRFNGGPEVEYAAVAVVPGKRYRFRLINISARSQFSFSIDNRESLLFRPNIRRI
jgi:hypothetical protein